MDDSVPTTLDPVTVSDGPVRVERTLDVRELGVIAAFSITCSGERPVRVSVVDYLPGNWRVEEIGFRHENRPDDGTATSETVRFEVTVEPGAERVVVYGVTLAAAVDVDAVERAQSFSEPRIASVEPVGAGEPPSSEAAEEGEGPSSAEGADDGEEPGEGAAGADEVGERVETIEVSDEDYPDDPADFFDRFGTSPAAEDREGADAGPPASEDRPPADADREPGSDGPARGARPADRSLVAALAEEIEAGDVDDEAVGRLRDFLVRKDRASTRMRLQRIESRQEEFGAYVEALRELIDEHGPAAEFVGELLASIEAVEDETEALREEVEAAADARASTRRELSAETDALGDRLAAVEDDVEGVGEEIDALAADLDEATEAASSLDAEVASLGGEVEALRDRVDALESTRRRLLDALEPGELPESSEGDRSGGEPDDGDA